METIEEKETAFTEAMELAEINVKAWQENVEWLKENRSWIEEVGLVPGFSGTSTFFHNPKHDQVIRIIREVGGKFTKTYNATSITYRNTAGDRWFYLCDSQPPGTCRMVPVVETVPAHWEPEKVISTFKLQCKEEGEGETADVELPEESTYAPADVLTPQQVDV